MTENTAIESLKRALKEAREAKRQTEAKLSDIRARIAELQEEESKLVTQLPKLNKVIEQTGMAYRVILQNELFPEDEEIFDRPARREEPRHETRHETQRREEARRDDSRREEQRREEHRRDEQRRDEQRREEMPVRYAQSSGSYQPSAPPAPPAHQPAMPDYDIPAAPSRRTARAEAPESDADLAAIESGIAEQKMYQGSGNVRFNDFRIPQAATIVLREAGHPLHVTEIYRRMADGGFEFRGQHQLITLAVSLSRAKRFRKVAPGTFELDPKYLSGQVA